MKLTTNSDPIEDDPMSDSNKENIITKQHTSQHVPFTTETDPHTSNLTSSTDCKPSSTPENALVMKQNALVSSSSE